MVPLSVTKRPLYLISGFDEAFRQYFRTLTSSSPILPAVSRKVSSIGGAKAIAEDLIFNIDCGTADTDLTVN